MNLTNSIKYKEPKKGMLDSDLIGLNLFLFKNLVDFSLACFQLIWKIWLRLVLFMKHITMTTLMGLFELIMVNNKLKIASKFSSWYSQSLSVQN